MSAFVFILAALAEIAGCFAFWAWLKLDKPVWWLIPAIGRAFAAYGGVHIVSALGWQWLIVGARPDRWDVMGGRYEMSSVKEVASISR